MYIKRMECTVSGLPSVCLPRNNMFLIFISYLERHFLSHLMSGLELTFDDDDDDDNDFDDDDDTCEQRFFTKLKYIVIISCSTLESVQFMT